MTQYERQGIFAIQKPTESEIAAIEQLATLCNDFEGLHIRLPGIGMFGERPGNETLDFLYYEQGQLVGYLGIDNYGVKEKECTGMVHPVHRRKGIARQLLQVAKEEARHSGIEQLVLDSERTSVSGMAFVKAIHAHLSFSEHEMVLGTFIDRPVFDERLTLRQAGSPEDLAMIVSIMATDMGDAEQAKRYVADMAKRSDQRFYLMTFGGPEVGCDEPVGSLRLAKMGQRRGIYGFVVHPEYRGKGYGRHLLQEVIRLVHSEGSHEIMLDVDVTNTNALGLYLSCGFEIKTTYDYYNIEVV